MNDSWDRLKNAGYRTRLYRYTLERRHIDRLTFLPHNPWPGDPGQADDLFRGRFRFAGREASAPNQPPWRLRPEDEEWQTELHGFDWLRHFEASGGEAALTHARRLVRSWIDLCDEIEPTTWAPGLLGRRLTSWLCHGGFLLSGADGDFADAFVNSLAIQWQHLQRTAADARQPEDQLTAMLGLVYGGMGLPGGDSAVAKGLRGIENLVSEQMHQDGGYRSRAPSDLLHFLRRIIGLRDALSESRREVPDWLESAIARAIPMLRGLRHGDGGLALFNGGYEESREALDITLTRSGVTSKALVNAHQSGFQRLSAGGAVLLADTAGPPGDFWGVGAHAGGGAFELSIGKQRLVVNCGSGRQRSPEWRLAARATAAHSTLHLENANAWAVTNDGSFGENPKILHCRRHEDDVGNTWLEMHHDGYGLHFGLIHRRRLYLDASGEDVRGEDRLDPNGPRGSGLGEAGHAVYVRFHLHPDVQASAVQGGSAVLLRLANGQGWRFRAGGADINLEETVYLGQPDSIRRSQQIVLSTTTAADGSVIKWAFRKV